MIALLRRGFEEEITGDRLAEALRRYSSGLPDDGVEHLAVELEEFLRAVPDALGAAFAMAKDRRFGHSIAFATGPILNYILDEEDLLPEASFGQLGLLDDAYLVHGFVGLLRQTYPSVEPESAGYTAPDARKFELVASLLPAGVAESLLRTCESTIQVAQAFFPSAPSSVAADSRVRPELRVGEALRAQAFEPGSVPSGRRPATGSE
jgi:hypothetical protein